MGVTDHVCSCEREYLLIPLKTQLGRKHGMLETKLRCNVGCDLKCFKRVCVPPLQLEGSVSECTRLQESTIGRSNTEVVKFKRQWSVNPWSLHGRKLGRCSPVSPLTTSNVIMSPSHDIIPLLVTLVILIVFVSFIVFFLQQCLRLRLCLRRGGSICDGLLQ